MEGEWRMRRLAVGVLALLAAVAIGTIAYQAGVSRGIALQPPPVAAAPAVPGGAQAAPPPPYPYYPYGYYRPWRGGFIGPLLGIFFFFFVLRALFWGACWGGGGGWRRRRWGYYDYPYDGPPRFDEWHRRAHDRMRDDPAAGAPTSV